MKGIRHQPKEEHKFHGKKLDQIDDSKFIKAFQDSHSSFINKRKLFSMITNNQ